MMEARTTGLVMERSGGGEAVQGHILEGVD